MQDSQSAPKGATNMVTGEDRWNRGYHAAAHAAHRLILEQHTELRRLLALGLVQTCLPSPDRKSAPSALPALVERIERAFGEHLTDEEAALLPLFGDDLDGPRRVQNVREQHGRQRREMEALQAVSTSANDDVFAEEFDRLARALLLDMVEEERSLARAIALLDEQAVPGRDGADRRHSIAIS